MFRFNFLDADDAMDGGEQATQPSPSFGEHEEHTAQQDVFREIPLDDLLKALPSTISYSPLQINITTNNEQSEPVQIVRRDLFDARYQLISQELDGVEGPGKDGSSSTLEIIDNPSDLLPGVYEGGLKTWECSIDLVDYLGGNVECSDGRPSVRGKYIAEVGCGTAVPTLYLLRELLLESSSDGQTAAPATNFYMQDYNQSVLELVTFPNVFLTWYFSPLYGKYYTDTENNERDASTPGEIQISPEMLDGFKTCLASEDIHLHLISGSWASLFQNLNSVIPRPCDIVLTSETIYRPSSLPILIDLIHALTTGPTQSAPQSSGFALCLVAAKLLYFGVGGGVLDFEEMVTNGGGVVETVLQREIGVGRKVMRVTWPELPRQ